jgi:putative DNA primase/helicase
MTGAIERLSQAMDGDDSADDTAEIERLAGLSRAEYDRARERSAKRLGVRVGTLDQMVKDSRRGDGEGSILLDDVEPWPEPVNGDALITEVVGLVNRYMVTPKGSAEIVAIWAILTHCFDCFQVVPRLAIQSPILGSGKTTLLTLIGNLVARPLMTSNVSPAVVFRVVDAHRPTLLLDEADSFLHDNNELRGILNSGHNRSGAYILRNVGDTHEPKRFSTWCPMAMAGISKLPPTLQSRSIVISLTRKRPDQFVQELREGRFDDLKRAARKIARWAGDQNFSNQDPDVPPALANRNADNWRPMFLIADRCGARWANTIREIAITMSGDRDLDLKEQLLADIKDLFDADGGVAMFSAKLCSELAGMDGRRWAEFKNGKPISQTQLSGLLKEFKAPEGVPIAPSTRRIGDHNLKGYLRQQFKAAWASYVTPPSAPYPSSQGVTTTQPNVTSGYSDFDAVTTGNLVTAQKQPKPALSNDCDSVTLQNGDTGQDTPYDPEREAIMGELDLTLPDFLRR